MYEAIVVLPLLGAIIAGVIALVGARNRHPARARRLRTTAMPPRPSRRTIRAERGRRRSSTPHLPIATWKSRQPTSRPPARRRRS